MDSMSTPRWVLVVTLLLHRGAGSARSRPNRLEDSDRPLSIPSLPPTEDWHYPNEEGPEMSALLDSVGVQNKLQFTF